MTAPESGDVWSFDYLWRWQHERGETEGRKPRPTALVACVKGANGRTNLFILPITKTRPSDDRLAVEIPQIERVRAGLAADLRLWVMIDEYNHDFLETSFYLDPKGRIGRFSSAFHKAVLAAFVQAGREKRLRKVPRYD
ncbi:conserved hypothetical protein [uncultured Pleomorphomonas sp.]|uniref:PemK-like protein n=1 Tax=uncultured Pleomorphomonas sp. TaxID=442121 RepID=A0A212LCN2_9HYPH|nr:hypothetical protein [uncultured Pleomorphomonas sp.]SCM75237.1 conserved hypothetical protein [uncultured Pleomorphomonas sp.]